MTRLPECRVTPPVEDRSSHLAPASTLLRSQRRALHPTPDHSAVTFVNGKGGDICIWLTQERLA